MNKLMLGLISVVMLVSVGINVTSAQDSATDCETVGGTFLINFVDPTTGLAVLSGDLTGAVRGVILDQTMNEANIMSLSLEHVIVTETGDMLMTTDEATLMPVDEGVFFMQQTQTIVGGTGRYAEATGTLTEFGAVDMGTGQGVLRYTGEICTGA
jgi:hypothetical protein